MLTTLMIILLFLDLCSFTEMLLSRPTITFFSTIKGSLYPQNSISLFDIRLGDGIHIGSDEERAIVNTIDIDFPGSNQLLCSKHLKDGTLNYMQSKVGVPQKVIEKAYVYLKFVNYFKNRLQPSIKNNAPTRKFNVTANWTNNNCESLNHITKLDANWKVKCTPDLINMLHEMGVVRRRELSIVWKICEVFCFQESVTEKQNSPTS